MRARETRHGGRQIYVPIRCGYILPWLSSTRRWHSGIVRAHIGPRPWRMPLHCAPNCSPFLRTSEVFESLLGRPLSPRLSGAVRKSPIFRKNERFVDKTRAHAGDTARASDVLVAGHRSTERKHTRFTSTGIYGKGNGR